MDVDAASTRSHEYRWVDPAVALQQLPHLSGLDYLTGVLDGTIPPPPIAVLMGFTAVSVSPGEVVMSCEPGQQHFNPLGMVHGGLACTLLDTVTGCAGHTTLAAGVGYSSIDINVRYLRPVLPDNAPLMATGTVVRPGSRVIFTEGTVVGADGRVLATATSTLAVLGPQGISG